MSQGPPNELKQQKLEDFKTKLGLIMFAFYTLLYVGFIFLCLEFPKVTAVKVGGLNVAVAYGFGLIIIAVVQALIYNFICDKREKLDSDSR